MACLMSFSDSFLPPLTSPADLVLDPPGLAGGLEVVGLLERAGSGGVDGALDRRDERPAVERAGLLLRHLLDLGGRRLARDIAGGRRRGGLRGGGAGGRGSVRLGARRRLPGARLHRLEPRVVVRLELARRR